MAMVLTPALLLALIALVVGLPAGLKLHDTAVTSMAEFVSATFVSVTVPLSGGAVIYVTAVLPPSRRC